MRPAKGKCLTWDWRSPTEKGYGRVCLKGENKMRRVHRVVFERIFGWSPEVVMHACDNPSCVNPDHLIGGTHAENRADCVSKNRQAIAEDHGRSVLTTKSVSRIKAMLRDGMTYDDVSARFGVHKNTIGRIARGETWKSTPCASRY